MAARKIFVCIIAFVCIVGIVAPATFAGSCDSCSSCKQPCKQPCDDIQTATAEKCNNDAWKKLGRGICNMATFPLEIPSQISKANITDGAAAAFTWGLLKGVGMTAFRALVGVYETVTFPFPCPEGYKPILTDPEFFLEDQIA